MKKILSFFAAFILLGAFTSKMWAQNYDFFAAAPSGQTLYYIIENDGSSVCITYPIDDYNNGYTGYEHPTGALIIPSSVTYNGTTYTVTKIRYYAFYKCIDLTSVTIPDGIISIGTHAFDGCIGLTSVIFNADSCIYAGYADGSSDMSVFRGCSNLTSITFGSNVKCVPSFLCYKCRNLSSVTIPNAVIWIGDNAFNECYGLREIHSLNPVAPQLGTNSFLGVLPSVPVYIPCSSSDSYYSRWGATFDTFTDEDGFTATSADEQQGTVQILTMPTCTSPQAVVYASANSGYHFDHWSDNSTANPYSLTVTEDLNLVAYFATDGGGTEGIDDIDAANIRIYSEAGRIVVEGTTDEVNVYDMTGRSVRNDNLPAGVYMVKVGNLPARKVVVMR